VGYALIPRPVSRPSGEWPAGPPPAP
jgi:hypothetical protein